MTAGIFHLHGCWKGKCNTASGPNPKGYFENLDVKMILIRRFGRLGQKTEPCKFQEGFRHEVMKLNPTDPWMVKHSAMYRNAWMEFLPRFVCVRREIDGIIGSNKAVNFLGTRDVNRMRDIIDAHHKEMDASGGVDVFVDELIEGNYTSICKALESCGLVPDERKIADFVEPEYWKRWSR